MNQGLWAAAATRYTAYPARDAIRSSEGKLMATKKRNVDLDELVDTMEQPEAYETQWYLDTQTGKLVGVSDEMTMALEDGEDEDEIAADLPDWQKGELEAAKLVMNDAEDRFANVPSFETRECYSLMEDFIMRVKDGHLREKLQIAISGKGAFSRFKDVLANAGPVREQWFAFERECKLQWARDWLESLDIETTWQPKGGA
jgi:hypothetical protein